MYWSWEVAFDVLPQLAKGVVVTIQATFVASILAYVLGLGIAILKMSKILSCSMGKNHLVSFRNVQKQIYNILIKSYFLLST